MRAARGSGKPTARRAHPPAGFPEDGMQQEGGWGRDCSSQDSRSRENSWALSEHQKAETLQMWCPEYQGLRVVSGLPM